MKRSNLFLELTTGLLALASFAFAESKANGSIPNAICRTTLHPCVGKQVILGQYITSNVKQPCIDEFGVLGTLVTAPVCALTVVENPF